MQNIPGPELDAMLRLRRDLLADGLTDNQIARLTKAKVLQRIRRGAYVPYDEWQSLGAENRHRVLGRAVLRTTHESTVLTHASSLIERGISLWDVPLTTVHTSQLDRARASRRGRDWVPHGCRLQVEEVENHDGIPISVASRAAAEICCVVDVEHALVAVNGLLRARAMTVDDFAEAVTRTRFWPGSATADLVLRLADPRLESVGEDRFSYLCFRQSLPRPVPQLEIYDEVGRVVARLDFSWPEHGLFVEFDGRVKYRNHRRPGETLDDFLMREKRREEQVCQLTGWTCVRVAWADLAHPQLLAARLRRLLGSRKPPMIS